MVGLVLLLLVFFRGAKDAVQGQQIEGIIANSEGGRRSRSSTYVYIYEPEGVKRLETSLQLFNGDGDVVPITKNGSSYRVGSPMKILVMSVLWIVWILVLMYVFIRYRDTGDSARNKRYTYFSSIMLVYFVMLMTVGY